MSNGMKLGLLVIAIVLAAFAVKMYFKHESHAEGTAHMEPKQTGKHVESHTAPSHAAPEHVAPSHAEPAAPTTAPAQTAPAATMPAPAQTAPAAPVTAPSTTK